MLINRVKRWPYKEMPLLFKLIPVFGMLFFGIGLRSLRLLKKEDGASLLRILFYLSIPALELLSIPELDLRPHYLHLPLACIVVFLLGYAVAQIAADRWKIPPAQAGTFLIAASVMNTSYVYPFLIAARGSQAFSIAVLFDFGNSLLIFTFAYAIACQHGQEKARNSVFLELVKSPPLAALMIALVLNLSGVHLPIAIKSLLEPLGATVLPLTMLALGLHFTPKIAQPRLVTAVLSIRMGLGFLLGWIAAATLHLTGEERIAVICCSAAPVGYTSLIYSSLTGLDAELAASAVSVSLVAGMFAIPLIIQCFG